ncbi:MAG: TlpA family protein disulfide reductase [Oscillospiraceae bacterium]|nr:TlpA family protein disulfide reductase [Oscillospiraceae bacterium]
MNQTTYKLIVTLLVLVIVIGGGMLLYNHLQDSVDLGEMVPTESISENLAPDFTVTDSDGNSVKLSDFRGKGVVLNFWASWCGPCKMEMPHFQAAYEQYGADVHFLMVNMSTAFGDSRSDAAAVLEEGGYTFHVYYDDLSECAYAYGINAIPVTAFIDADGNLVSMKTGAMNAADLDRRILAILG